MNPLYSRHNMMNAGLCIGCGSCVAQAEVNGAARMEFDAYGQLKPAGPTAWLKQPSEVITGTCPFSPAALNEDQLSLTLFPEAQQATAGAGRFINAYVGFAAEEDFRLQGSSGGMVSWVATELMRQGLIDGVAHVVATDDPQQEGHFFNYRISRTEEEIRAGAKSRYYPVEMSEILKTIANEEGRYAVVGIPCFIKAVQLLRKANPLYRDRIRFTLGLFCGHMKSARFVESFAWQMKVPVTEIKKVEFRYKDASRPANWYNAMLTLRDGTVVNKDWWHLADGDWGAGFFMNNACNFCDDVMAETSDVSFGDAWVEPYSSDGRGTNVVVVRSAVVEQLISNAIENKRLQLQTVDGAFVEQTQAAGLRQRREGLAYRLTWARPQQVKPVKRVHPADDTISADRKRIYRMRYAISEWSHRMFRLASRSNMPWIYVHWARWANSLYYAFAYHKGKLGEVFKRLKVFR